MERSRLRRAGALFLSAALLTAFTATTAAAATPAAQATCQGKLATIVGTRAADVLTGTDGPDVIAGLGGNDIINGRGGNDLICGGPGRDRLVGGAGRDRLYGNGGADKLIGGAAADLLFGGTGNDLLGGRTGNDRLNGGPGTDTCYQDAGGGPVVGCELPLPTPPPPPPPPSGGQLVVGGPGSGQIAGAFNTYVLATLGPWSISNGYCRTGRFDYGASGIDEYRYALEFPLGALPAGSTILSVKLSVSATSAAPTQDLYGYAADGSISTDDAIPVGPSLTFDAPAAGYQVVDVSSLVTPAMIAAGWAGFLQMRETSGGQIWDCRTTDSSYPKLTIEYRLPS